MKTYQLAKRRIELAKIIRDAAINGWLNPQDQPSAELRQAAERALGARDELRSLPTLTAAQRQYLRRRYTDDVDIQCWLH